MKTKTILLMSLLVVLLSVVSIATQWNPFPNTDYNQIRFFADLVIQKGTFSYEHPLNSQFKYPVVGIRGLMNFEGDVLGPSVIPGVVIVYSIFRGIGEPLLYLVNPLFTLLTLFFFYLILDKYIFPDSRATTLIVTTFFGLSAAFLYVSATPFKDIIVACCFFVMIYYSFNFIEKGKLLSLSLASLFLGLSVWMNYPAVVFAFPLGVAFLIKRRREFLNVKNLTIALLVLFLVMFPLVYFQEQFTGGFMKFNSPILRINYSQAYQTPGILSFLLDFDFQKLFVNFVNQVFFLSPIIVFFSVIGFINVFLKKSANSFNLKILFWILVLQTLFYLPKRWSGEDFVGSPGTSYSRYLLVSWGIFFTFGIKEFFKKVNSRKVLMVVLSLILVLGIFTGIYGQMSVKYFIDTSNWAADLRDQIRGETADDSVFFVGFYDKYIYPTREMIIYPAIPREERIVETINMAYYFCSEGREVYFTRENPSSELDFSFNEYKSAFEKEGFMFEEKFGYVFRVRCPQ